MIQEWQPLMMAAMEAKIDSHYDQLMASNFTPMQDRILTLDIGRNTGKTSLMAEKCQTNDLIIVLYGNMFDRINRIIRRREHTQDCRISPVMCTVRSAESKLRGFRVNRIWIDDASIVEHHATYDMYPLLYMLDPKQIILLG